jgi:hypothetical protein
MRGRIKRVASDGDENKRENREKSRDTRDDK